MATHQEVAAILAKAAERGMWAMKGLADERSRQVQEAELLEMKRANARKRQAKCRAKRKQKEAFVAPMEHAPTIEHVPTMDMDIVSDYHDEHGEEEPAEATDAPQEKSQRADRLEHNKQASLASFIIENLRARVPLNTNFQRLCKVCALSAELDCCMEQFTANRTVQVVGFILGFFCRIFDEVLQSWFFGTQP